MPSHALNGWNPEDARQWERQGRRIARRNLWISIPALLLSFAVWMVWSVVVVNLPRAGFSFSTNQLFWLAALPGLSGATLRMFYAFMVPVFGGRRWTALSTASLLIPALGIGFAVRDPTTSYPAMLLLALLCGLGGGNFASSMANVSFFFPSARQGAALGLNAGLGNLGVPLMQWVTPLAISAGVFGALGGAPQSAAGSASPMWLQNAGFIWAPPILLTALAAWFWMDDIAQTRVSFAEQAVIFRRKHNWLMAWLYLGSFGSFIGFSAGFPLLMQSQFAAADPMRLAFLGPLVGALARPLGGWLADRVGGARVTLWSFVAMTAGALGLLSCLPSGPCGGQFAVFFALSMLLFALSGIGNGSTFRMIPVIFLRQRQREARDAPSGARVAREAAVESAAALGFASAIAAYGAFFIPKSFGASIALTGGPDAALCALVAFYASCIALTWWYYARRDAEAPC